MTSKGVAFHKTPRTGYDPSWRQHAECADAKLSDFYPELDGIGAKKHFQAIVERYCSACPVRAACLSTALTNYESGIWGGTNERQRVAMRRAARVTA